MPQQPGESDESSWTKVSRQCKDEISFEPFQSTFTNLLCCIFHCSTLNWINTCGKIPHQPPGITAGSTSSVLHSKAFRRGQRGRIGCNLPKSVQTKISPWQPKENIDVSENGGFSPQIIHFNRVFDYKPSILGYPYFWKDPYILQDLKTLHPNHLDMLDPLASFGMVSCHGLTLSTLVVTEIRLQWNFKENYM